MTDNKSSLGNRMKRYEAVPRTHLTPRMPMLIRVDGRAFHTYTKRFRQEESPWNLEIRDAMTATAQELMREIAGAKIAYIQSDEISVLVTDYDSHTTKPWFDKVAQKVVSVSAALATSAFNRKMFLSAMEATATVEIPPPATFDSRAFVVPRDDVTNYFLWRQRDATKNSIAMLAQKHFLPKQLHGKHGGEMQEMLWKEKGINWNDCEVWQKRGWCVLRTTTVATSETIEIGDRISLSGEASVRSIVGPDWEIPIFSQDREYIERFVNVDQE